MAVAGLCRSQYIDSCSGDDLDRPSLRLLIVEDEPELADVMAEVLRDEGHHVRLAADGIVALEAVASCIPDAILLDLFLPRLDGYEVVRELKRDARTVGIPLVVVTGAHAAEERAAEIGTPHLLKKPFNIGDLITCIEGLGTLAA